MRLTAEQLEKAVEQIEELTPRRNRVPAHREMTAGELYRDQRSSATEFVGMLQGTLESIARRERRQALLRALAKFAEALRIEGD